MRKVKGIGRDKAVTLVAAFALANQMARGMQDESPVLDNPENVVALLRAKNLAEKRGDVAGAVPEHRDAGSSAWTKLLTARSTRCWCIRARCSNAAIAANAAAIVLAHNHPSGDPTPSEADIKVTRDLIRAGQLLKIDVLDHVIIGRATAERQKDYVSLRELGYFSA